LWNSSEVNYFCAEHLTSDAGNFATRKNEGKNGGLNASGIPESWQQQLNFRHLTADLFL
jgi:hypothetical protein